MAAAGPGSGRKLGQNAASVDASQPRAAKLGPVCLNYGTALAAASVRERHRWLGAAILR
jgi:hypothetical protein